LVRRLILAVFLVAAPVGWAHAQTPPVDDCDRLAAHPLDPRKRAPGVAWSELDADKAIPACEAAVRAYPDELRFAYQLARAIDRAGKPDRAFAMYRFLANEGYAAAELAVGLMYDEGLGGAVADATTAAGWFMQAAEHGHPEAQRLLGLMYVEGAGVERDLGQAMIWLRMSAEQGYALGELALADNLIKDGTDAEAQTANQEAAAWYRRAAEQGQTRAQAALAALYERGRGVERSLVQAYAWLALAVDGDPTLRATLDALAKELSVAERAEAERQMDALRQMVQKPET
jgi:TPR repeat protein